MAHSCVFIISSSSEMGAWLIVVSLPSSEAGAWLIVVSPSSHHLLRLVHGS